MNKDKSYHDKTQEKNYSEYAGIVTLDVISAKKESSNKSKDKQYNQPKQIATGSGIHAFNSATIGKHTKAIKRKDRITGKEIIVRNAQFKGFTFGLEETESNKIFFLNEKTQKVWYLITEVLSHTPIQTNSDEPIHIEIDEQDVSRVFEPEFDINSPTHDKRLRRFMRDSLHAIKTVKYTTEDGKDGILGAGYSGYNRKTKKFYFNFSPEAKHDFIVYKGMRPSKQLYYLQAERINTTKYKCAFALAYKLCYQAQVKPMADVQDCLTNTESVRSLYGYIETRFPSIEELREKERSPKRFIIKPIIDALNHLTDDVKLLHVWEFLDESKRAIPYSDLLDKNGNDRIPNFDEFLKWHIKYKLAFPAGENKDTVLNALLAKEQGREKGRIKAEAVKREQEKKKKRIDKKTENYIAKALAKNKLNNKEQKQVQDHSQPQRTTPTTISTSGISGMNKPL